LYLLGIEASACLDTGQRLDGGSIFGNALPTLCSTWSMPGALEHVELACELLLVDQGNRLILHDGWVRGWHEIH
jgi:hypothetical protein